MEVQALAKALELATLVLPGSTVLVDMEESQSQNVVASELLSLIVATALSHTMVVVMVVATVADTVTANRMVPTATRLSIVATESLRQAAMAALVIVATSLRATAKRLQAMAIRARDTVDTLALDPPATLAKIIGE